MEKRLSEDTNRSNEEISLMQRFATNYLFEDFIGGVRNTILRKLPFEGIDGFLSNYYKVPSCSHSPLWTSSIMVRKSAITVVGGFPEAVCSGKD